MSKLWRKLSKILLVTLLFLLAFSATFISFPLENEISYAVVPKSYKINVKDNNLDWQHSADYLNLENAKKIVKSWADDKAYDFSGFKDKPIVVAVIDTGIRFDHELFSGKYDKDGEPIKSDVSVGNYDVLFRQNREIVCRNTVSNKTDLNVCSDINDLVDDHDQKHGTHVAGIIATLIHEFDLEEYIKIMPIKASNPAGTFYPADFKQAIEFAVLKGADVVNMSLGDGKNPSFAIPDNLVNKAVFVAAAGNNGYNSSSSAFYPAATPNVIGVMNYQEGLPLSLNQKSNYGDKYDICAPGTCIYNANGLSKINYKPMSGTSMASPMVAFAGALLTLKYRALEKTTGFEIMPDNVRKMLIAEPSKSLNKGIYKFPTLELDTVVATDFLNDARFADTINQSPETLKILPNNKLEFEQDRTEDITFDVKISPTDYVDGLTVNWFEVVGGNKTLIGSGKRLVYSPKNKVGEYILRAEIEGSHVYSEVTVKIVEKRIIKEEISIKVDANFRENNNIAIGDKVYFYLEDVENVNMSLAPVKWYVNDELMAVGNHYIFSSLSSGEYYICAKFNGEELLHQTVVINKCLEINPLNFETPLKLFSYTFLGVVTLVGIIMIIIGETRRYKNKKRNKQ